MSNKLRKKKNNHTERKYSMNKAITSNYGVIRMNTGLCYVLDLSTNRVLFQPSAVVKNALMQEAYKWTIMLVVGCTESNGKFKMVTDQFTFKDRRTHKDLAKYLGTEHTALAEKCEKHNTVDYVGWIGSVIPNVDFDLEATASLFKTLGDYLDRKNND